MAEKLAGITMKGDNSVVGGESETRSNNVEGLNLELEDRGLEALMPGTVKSIEDIAETHASNAEKF